MEIKNKQLERQKTIVKTSIIGIVANVLLAAFKALVGIISHSVAITLDAVNNITDATASVVTIIGTKLAGKEPNKKHPFGYGRIEYITAMVIAVIVLYAGITALIESIKKIIDPVSPDYSLISIIIISVAVVVKIVLGLYVKSVGKRVKSDSLINSGQDALLDAVISVTTVIAAILYVTTGISTEAYLGAVISLVIIKSGLDMLRETISQLLGESNDVEKANEIKKTVRSFEGVRGTYDMVLHNYGPDTYHGSLHIEVPEDYTANEIDKLIRDIQTKVYEEHGVVLTAIGVYSYNTSDEESVAIRKRVTEIAMSNEYVTGVHGFYFSRENQSIRFDIVISFNAPSRSEEYNKVYEAISKEYPDYMIIMALDTDYSEE